MTELTVKVNSPYKVIIDDSLTNLGKVVKSTISAETIAILTDSNVEKLYLDTVKKSLTDNGFNVIFKVIPAGEKSKNFDTYKEILEFLLENKLTRQDCLISLGGGVVSDIGGFSASTYLRGISHIIVPTTLLSIIDASIGGKTGIDTEFGKNLVGSFYEPKLVYSSLDTLKSLSNDDIVCGLGEGIKYGLLLGGRCFEILESGLNKDNFLEFVTLCVKCKIDIVVEDEKESGSRKLLNLGHTFGHAIEMATNMDIPHGVAVGLGIDKILSYSNVSANEANRVKSILQKYGIYNYQHNDKNLLQYINMDKKRGKNDSIDIIVLDKIGFCRIKTCKLEELNEN